MMNAPKIAPSERGSTWKLHSPKGLLDALACLPKPRLQGRTQHHCWGVEGSHGWALTLVFGRRAEGWSCDPETVGKVAGDTEERGAP